MIGKLLLLEDATCRARSRSGLPTSTRMRFYPLRETLQGVHERNARAGKVDAEECAAVRLAVDRTLRKLDLCLVFQPCGKRGRIEAKRSRVHPGKIRRPNPQSPFILLFITHNIKIIIKINYN